MAEEKKKETRIMKVTLDADEFKKFDKGITHSDSGLRNEQGRLSALPDISPISEDELPRQEVIREVVRTEVVYPNPVYEASLDEASSSDSLLFTIAKEFIDATLGNPDFQQAIIDFGEAFLEYKVIPGVQKLWKKVVGGSRRTIKSEKDPEEAPDLIIEDSQPPADLLYEIEVTNERQDRIVVSEEDAMKLVSMVREEAQKLSALIFLLSNITVKNNKTEEEYMLEKLSIKQLVSEESRKTMETLVAHRELLADEKMAIQFSDFLDGYIRRGDQRIAIPIETSGTVDTGI